MLLAFKIAVLFGTRTRVQREAFVAGKQHFYPKSKEHASLMFTWVRRSLAPTHDSKDQARRAA